LLGWSAFAGFVVLLAGWPLNSFLAGRSIRIQKGVLAARDKRMSVLNELIGAVSVYISQPCDKLIIFFWWTLYAIGEIHKVLCMGGEMDWTSFRCEGT
jgi:hypothetical protein